MEVAVGSDDRRTKVALDPPPGSLSALRDMLSTVQARLDEVAKSQSVRLKEIEAGVRA